MHEKHRPFVVEKRLVNRQGENIGCLVRTEHPNVTETHSLEKMLDNYVNGYDYEIIRGGNVSELIIVHRLTENGMSYHFRSIHNHVENDNYNALPSEISDLV